MIKHGYTNCSGCHADPSGGELLTLYGHAISWEALSTKWGGNNGAAAADEWRTARVVSRAAHAKSARPKKAATNADASDDSAAASDDSAKDDNAGDGPAAKSDGGDAKGKDKKDKGDADKNDDGEDAAEEEASANQAGAPAEADKSSSAGGAEPSPFAGMSGITGPLFGLLKPNDDLLIGGSWRFATAYTPDAAGTKVAFFPMQLDVYGQLRFLKSFRIEGSLGAGKVPAGSPYARPAQVTTNQGDGYNLLSRTHWVGFDFGEGAHTIRVGRLNLPFGVRISEHTMWVRDKTQTNRESQQEDGASLFMGFDWVRFEIMAIAGNFQENPDKYRERGASGYAEFVLSDHAVLGVSALRTESKNDPVYLEPYTTDRGAYGLYTRASPGKAVAILAEGDVLSRSRRELGYVGFLQVDTEMVSGLHLLTTGEVLDAGFPKGGGPAHVDRMAGMGKPEFGAWFGLQWFFLPHFDLRVDSIIRTDREVLAQLHIYL